MNDLLDYLRSMPQRDTSGAPLPRQAGDCTWVGMFRSQGTGCVQFARRQSRLDYTAASVKVSKIATRID